MTPATTTSRLRIATRGSALARWQAEHVAAELRARHPDLEVELVFLKTTGDRIQDRPLSQVGGKGLFVKEIEEALLDGRADLAVHSLKDVPAELAAGLVMLATPPREDPRDALCLSDALAAAPGQGLERLPPGARVGTSSLRRSAQLRALRPDLEILPLRGNVDTRLGKIGKEIDAAVLACAGLRRLGLEHRIHHAFTSDQLLPAIGQGALGLEGRAGDEATRRRVAPLDDPTTAVAVAAERAFLARLEGGCQVPLAAHARVTDPGPAGGERTVSLEGLIAAVDGKRVVRGTAVGRQSEAAALGKDLAERLLAQGGDVLLAALAGRG
jgi:hydroxymethylbilane synthase